ncbi:MAG: EAL domain-containing protein [Burkholderiales bacterium]|nr:EAL domain-containing protein [Burkholderiales bacterium]
MHLITDLRAALSHQQLQLYYQPIVDLASGEAHKAEALLRWKHPERGFISPAEFIPVAESTGMIHEIGDWVFHEAARQAAGWRRERLTSRSASTSRRCSSRTAGWPSRRGCTTCARWAWTVPASSWRSPRAC